MTDFWRYMFLVAWINCSSFQQLKRQFQHESKTWGSVFLSHYCPCCQLIFSAWSYSKPVTTLFICGTHTRNFFKNSPGRSVKLLWKETEAFRLQKMNAKTPKKFAYSFVWQSDPKKVIWQKSAVTYSCEFWELSSI